jgi:chaperonin GroES
MIETTVDVEDDVEPVGRQPLTLEQIAQADNLVPMLERSDISAIGADCKQQLERDEQSRDEWIKTHDMAMEMALQQSKAKDYPFQGASNVVYPLITTGAVQFAARAYPAIIPGREVVKAKVIGDDSGLYQVDMQTGEQQEVEPAGLKAGRASRIAKWMSFQLLEVEPSWESDTDTMLHYLPIAGCAFRKRWWDRGPKSKFCSARDVVVNMSAQALETAQQISECFALYYHEVKERANRDLYDRDAVDQDLTGDEEDQIEMVEAHCRIDLDEDGYPEPYIVTMNKDSGAVYRIVQNFGRVELNELNEVIAIEPRAYYVKYDFIPNPDGGFYGIGFGWLLGPINRAINTAINQLNDAAHWQNSPAGFIGKRLRLKAGDTRFRPGEYKPVEAVGEAIRNDIVTLDFNGPSNVTFQLLGLMINAGQDISSVKDIMLGDMEQNVAPTTALTLVEQGQKSFTAIYKRVHRALKKEMKLLLQHNKEHVDQIAQAYVEVLDHDEAAPEDFMTMAEVVPLTDPDMVSESAAMAKAQFLESLAMQGRVDPQESLRRTLMAANIEDIEALMPKSSGEPDPEIMLKMAKIENDKLRIQNDTARMESELMLQRTEAIKNLAQAEAEEEGQQIARYKAEVDAIGRVLNEVGKLQGMAAQPSDGGGAGPDSQAGGPQGMAGNGAGAQQLGNGPAAQRGPDAGARLRQSLQGAGNPNR